MHRAYVFRRGVTALPENRDSGEIVSVDEYDPEWGDQVRCTYEPCFQELIPVVPAVARSYWRHPPDPAGTKYCPHRSPRDGSPDWQPSRAALEDLVVKHENFPGGCRVVYWAAADGYVAEFGDDIVAVPLHQGNVRRMAGLRELDGRVIFPIVALDDLEAMNQANLAPLFRKALAQIVARQPVLVVRPALEGPAGAWGLLTSPGHLGVGTIEECVVDALPVIVDARSLFRGPAEDSGSQGSWPPPGALPIWIRPFHKEGVDAAKEALEECSPLGGKVLRLLVKRLLVDGAGVHRILFGQTREEARDFFLVSERTFPRADQVVREAELSPLAGSPQFAAFLAESEALRECFETLATDGRRREEARAEAERRQAREREQRIETGIRTVSESVDALDTRLGGSISQLEERVGVLRRQIRSLERDARPVGKSLADLDGAVKELRDGAKNLSEEVESLSGDLGAECEARLQEEESLRGTLETLGRGVGQEVSDLRCKLDAQGKRLHRQGLFERGLAGALGVVLIGGIAVAVTLWPGRSRDEVAEAQNLARTIPTSIGGTGSEASSENAAEPSASGDSMAELGGGSGLALPEGSNAPGHPDEAGQPEDPGLLDSPSQPEESGGSGGAGRLKEPSQASQPEGAIRSRLDPSRDRAAEGPAQPAFPLPSGGTPLESSGDPQAGRFGTLAIEVGSERPQGGLIVYLGGERIWECELAPLEGAPPATVAERRLDAGPIELTVYRWRAGRAPDVRTLRGDLPAGASLTLQLRIDRGGHLDVALTP